ncbi:thiocillin family RiPP [Lysinibacillus sp. NPDC056232]
MEKDLNLDLYVEELEDEHMLMFNCIACGTTVSCFGSCVATGTSLTSATS